MYSRIVQPAEASWLRRPGRSAMPIAGAPRRLRDGLTSSPSIITGGGWPARRISAERARGLTSQCRASRTVPELPFVFEDPLKRAHEHDARRAWRRPAPARRPAGTPIAASSGPWPQTSPTTHAGGRPGLGEVEEVAAQQRPVAARSVARGDPQRGVLDQRLRDRPRSRRSTSRAWASASGAAFGPSAPGGGRSIADRS